jgi:hypothetical protein
LITKVTLAYRYATSHTVNVATYIARFYDAIVGPDAFMPMMFPRNDCMSFDVFLNPGVNFNFHAVND